MTIIYIKLHLQHLHNIEVGLQEDDVLAFPSLYDHMNNFLVNLGLSSEEAWNIIDEFRYASNI